MWDRNGRCKDPVVAMSLRHSRKSNKMRSKEEETQENIWGLNFYFEKDEPLGGDMWRQGEMKRKGEGWAHPGMSWCKVSYLQQPYNKTMIAYNNNRNYVTRRFAIWVGFSWGISSLLRTAWRVWAGIIWTLTLSNG